MTYICNIYTLRDLDEVSLNIKNEIFRLNSKKLRDLRNKYHDNKIDVKENKVDRLLSYFSILQRLKDQALNGSKICLDQEDIQNLIEKIRRITGKNCTNDICDIKIDKSNEEAWVMKKPHCRSYESWEKWAKYFCGKLKMDITTEKISIPNLIFEISREIITPNVLMAISVYKEANNLNLEINRTKEETKVDFELLVEKIPNFDLTLDMYREVVSHNVSFDIVKTIYDSGLSLNVTTEELELKTPIDAYSLLEISGDVDPSYLKKFGMKTTINKKDLLQDYK